MRLFCSEPQADNRPSKSSNAANCFMGESYEKSPELCALGFTRLLRIRETNGYFRIATL